MNRLTSRASLALALAAVAASSLVAAPAEPDAPGRLPGEVVGVVGSGDQLSLRVRREDGASATLNPGDEYRDGWRLQSLTAEIAILAKGGETRRVGLNPTGAVAAAQEDGARPVIGRMLSAQDSALIEAGATLASIAQLSPVEAEIRLNQLRNLTAQLANARTALVRQTALRDQGFGAQQTYDAAAAAVTFLESQLDGMQRGQPTATMRTVPSTTGAGGGGGGGG